MLVLPYQVRNETLLLNQWKRDLGSFVVPMVIFTGSKLSLKFQVKDKTIFSNCHDVIYHGNCLKNGCADNYIGETTRRILERVLDHNGKDINRHLYKHSIKTGHWTLDIRDYRIIGKGYGNNCKKWETAKALLNKELKSTLKKQDKSMPLKLFN